VPHERASELGGRRVEDLAAMCQQLARGGASNPLDHDEIVSR
jgi:hypothetical protein